MEKLPLLLVPGLMCDEAVWTPLLPALETHAEPHIVDHGDEDSITGMAQRLLAHAPAKFALAGHSMGGRVALEVVRLAPQRVLRLALLDTGYQARATGSAGEEEVRKRQALLDLALAQGVRAMAQQWVQGMVHPDRLKDAPLITAILDMFARKTPDIFERQIRALLNRPDASPVLRTLHVPTLVLCGRQDSWAPVGQHEAIVGLAPSHATLRVIDHAGHMSTMEQPTSVGQALCEWLTQPAGDSA